MFGERGKFIISSGNDKAVKVWDWLKHRDQGETSNESGSVHLNINLKKKVMPLRLPLYNPVSSLFLSFAHLSVLQVNWLCTTPSDSENLIICDTTKVVKAYSIC